MKQKVIIIGAGIGGLATANILAKAGYDVTIYEKNADPGGRAGVLTKDGFTFDTGPSWYLMPEVFDHYFKLLGTTVAEQLDIIKLEPSYKVFFENNEPVTITPNLSEAQKTFEAIEPGAGAALRKYVAESRYVYDMSLKHFLYTNVRSLPDLFKWEIIKSAPRFVHMVLQSFDSRVSNYFRDRRLKQILEYSMVFLGASPYKAPAIYTLMSALDFELGVYYPKGGMYTLITAIERLGKSLGVQYHYNSAVSQIITENGAAVGVELEDGQIVRADIVISNADLHHTETSLLAPAERTYPQAYWDKRTAGPSALLLYLGVRGSLPELEHHSLFFVDDWEGNFDAIYKTKTIPEHASLYVSRATVSDPQLAPEGDESVVVLVPYPAGLSVSAEDCETLADRYIAQLGQMAGITDLAGRVASRTVVGPDDFAHNFNSWEYTALGPSHTLRQTAWFRMHNKSRKVKNLYYVGGSTIPGVGLPMCIIGAELVYKHLAGIKQGGQVDSIEPIGSIT